MSRWANWLVRRDAQQEVFAVPVPRQGAFVRLSVVQKCVVARASTVRATVDVQSSARILPSAASVRSRSAPGTPSCFRLCPWNRGFVPSTMNAPMDLTAIPRHLAAARCVRAIRIVPRMEAPG